MDVYAGEKGEEGGNRPEARVEAAGEGATGKEGAGNGGRGVAERGRFEVAGSVAGSDGRPVRAPLVPAQRQQPRSGVPDGSRAAPEARKRPHVTPLGPKRLAGGEVPRGQGGLATSRGAGPAGSSRLAPPPPQWAAGLRA